MIIFYLASFKIRLSVGLVFIFKVYENYVFVSKIKKDTDPGKLGMKKLTKQGEISILG